jgi:outer membrane protein W
MKGSRGFFVCVTILLLAAGAGADDDGFSRSGPYLGVGATGAIHLFEDEVQKESGGLAEVEDSAGLNARLGYRALSWLALEAQYEWVAGLDFVATQDLGPVAGKGDTLARLQSHTVTANLKLLLPIWRIQPYLLAGIGGAYYVIDDKTGFGAGGDEWAFAGRVGVGGDLYLTKNLLAFVEVSGVLTTLDITAPTTSQSLTGLYYLSTQLGLQWRF